MCVRPRTGSVSIRIPYQNIQKEGKHREKRKIGIKKKKEREKEIGRYIRTFKINLGYPSRVTIKPIYNRVKQSKYNKETKLTNYSDSEQTLT